MKRFLLLSLFFLLVKSAIAQQLNDSLETRIQTDSSQAGELQLHLQNFNYLRNYEFFNKFQDGYTLFGTHLSPQLVYHPDAKLSVAAGVLLRQDFGTSGIYKSYPLLTLKYQTKSTALLFGALEGSINHRFIEPVVDYETRIVDPVEYGLQVVINNKKLFLDGFLNWKNMIYKPATSQERLYAGISADVTFVERGDVRISFPGQLLIFHQGGQIDVTGLPLQTLMNAAAGVKFAVKSEGFVKQWRTENYLLSSQELSPEKKLPYSSGAALFLNGGLDSKAGTLLLSYWFGNGYTSGTGMPIYQSVSQQINNVGLKEKHRQLVFLRYAYQRQLIKNLYLDFRFEPVVDLNRPDFKLDHSETLFLVYRQQIRLFKKK